jgi:hypothetical protein
VSGNTRIIAFRGIPKREEILLRSFLNLADSDFDCRVEADDSKAVDVVVLDESVLKSDMKDLRDDVNYIVLGTEGPHSDLPYVSRPLHWSSFTQVFEEVVSSGTTTEQSPSEGPEEGSESFSGAVPPDDSKESGSVSETEQDEDDSEPGPVLTGEQASMSEPPELTEPVTDMVPDDISSLEVVGGQPGEAVLPPGVTSSKELGESGAGGGGGSAAVSPVDQDGSGAVELKLSETDEETVLVERPGIGEVEDTVVIETDFIEAWTISIEAELNSVSQSLHEMKRTPLAREPAAKKSPVPNLGVRLPAGIRFWEGDAELLLGGSPLFLIDETGQRLYSDSPIREWTKILREPNLVRRDLSEGWYVDPSVKSSPLPWFLWCSAQARSKGRLLKGIDPGQEYLLEKWPNFELIRNDNQSLRLCALLFSRPESVKSLVAKSAIKGRKVVAFMNACHLLGLIKMTGIDEEVVWSNIEDTSSLSLRQRLRRLWGS